MLIVIVGNDGDAAIVVTQVQAIVILGQYIG